MENAAKISTLICAEASEGATLVAWLARDADLVIVDHVTDVCEASVAIDRLSPSLVLLDVPEPEANGFWATVASIASNGHRAPFIVLVSSRTADAHLAFEARALDFLLKPVSDTRVADALAAVKVRLAERRAYELGMQIASLLRPEVRKPTTYRGHPAEAPTAPLATPPSAGHYAEYFMARLGGKVTLVRVDDVDWIEADDYYAKLHAGGKTHLIRETLQQLEAKLDPRQFVRVHRSAIVRIDRVQTLHPYCRGAHMLTLKDGTCITLSRSRRAAFQAALGGHV
jgi:two-component system LytT family response regulator